MIFSLVSWMTQHGIELFLGCFEIAVERVVEIVVVIAVGIVVEKVVEIAVAMVVGMAVGMVVGIAVRFRSGCFQSSRFRLSGRFG
jgi:hypothetical protein